MSHLVKINAAILSIIGSALATGTAVTWLASAKANDITTAQEDIRALKEAERVTNQSLSRLDERTALILKQLEHLNERLKP
jgi:hypothetical protein